MKSNRVTIEFENSKDKSTCELSIEGPQKNPLEIIDVMLHGIKDLMEATIETSEEMVKDKKIERPIARDILHNEVVKLFSAHMELFIPITDLYTEEEINNAEIFEGSTMLK